MNISRFLGKTIGIYLVIVSLVLLLHSQQFFDTLYRLINDGPLMFVTGFFTLIIGILLVVSHNIWEWNWRVIITIISWITLLKALSILLYPQLITQTSVLFVQNVSYVYIAGGIDLILGLILCYFGFKR